MAYVLGLTGTFGSGKSTAAAMLVEGHGAFEIDADALARRAVEPGMPALEQIARQFGARYLDGTGGLRRRELAELVFSDRGALAALEAIIHPWVRAEEVRLLGEQAHRPLIVLNVPLLYEAGMESMADSVAVVVIEERQRYGRLRAAGFSEVEITRRLGMQMAQARKRARADHLIENSGSREATRRQIDELVMNLKGATPSVR